MRNNVTGQKFGRLTAVSKVGKTSVGESIWLFSCECGKTTNVPVSRVTSGKTKSCGCFSAESRIGRGKTHGMSHTPAHRSWISMVQRCSDPSDPHKVKYYGDVEIEPVWTTNFSDFYNHIGDQPNDSLSYSIERIKNQLGYVYGNVRWATQTEQARNKKLQRCSQTGVNGVTLCKVNRRGHEELRYAATVYMLNGKRKSKAFSVRKYGLLPAFNLACMARESMIADLNSQGAGYTELHGK